MSLVADVVVALRAAMATIAEGREQIAAAQAQADEMMIAVQQATDGTNDPRPAEVIAHLLQARERLDEAREQLNASDEAVETYIANTLGVTGSAAPVPEQRPTISPPPSPSRPPFKPMRTDPDKRDEITPYVGLDYAVATLWDSDGSKVLGPHEADDDGPAATANWKQPWGDYPRLRRHVEAHAAARMKRDEEQVTVMYINIPPCSYWDGCKANLRDIIPKGSTLWVHQVRPSGTVDVKPYRGTGRAYE